MSVITPHQSLKAKRQRLVVTTQYQHRLQQIKFPDVYRQRGIQNLLQQPLLKVKEGKKR